LIYAELCGAVGTVLQYKTIRMKTNEVLQKDVQDAIKWEPLLNAAEIGVTVKDGVVTLTGTVDTFIKKSEAEDAAKKVAGVKAVVEKIEINSGNSGKMSDGEIASEVLNALKWNSEIPKDKIQVNVDSGWVTLEGELSWNYQKEAAKKVATNLTDVKWVTNNISIKSERIANVEKEDVEKALNRNWLLEDKHILVSVSENKVKLNGTVHSWYQKDEASRIAWNAPGVSGVDNELTVDYQ
jgi:osmotically-inducible protein OsmY